MKTKVDFRLEEPELEKLRSHADKTGTTVSQLLRWLVVRFLKETQNGKRKSLN